MADVLEDDDPSELSEHRFGYQEWDKLEENFMNVGSGFSSRDNAIYNQHEIVLHFPSIS